MIAATRQKGVGILRRDPGLLRFFAGVDLHEQQRLALLCFDFLG